MADNTYTALPCGVEDMEFQKFALKNGRVVVKTCDVGDDVSVMTPKRISIAVANVEQSYAFPANTTRFLVYNDGRTVAKLSFVAGFGADYVSLYPSCHWGEKQVSGSRTLYFKSAKAGDIIEIVTWS